MPRKGSRAKPQKPKKKRRDYSYTDISKEMSQKEFEKGSKDGGFNNWIPYKGQDPTDKSQLSTPATMPALIPKDKREKIEYR